MSKFCRFAVVGLLCLVGVVFAGASARADHSYVRPCCYKKVVVYKKVIVARKKCVIKYDHCGNAYETYTIDYSTIRVPVVKLVKICD